MKGLHPAVFVSLLLVISSTIFFSAEIGQESFEILEENGNGFQGPSAGSRANETFTIVVQPDSQILAQSYPAIYTNQTEWIVNYSAAWNMKYVLHAGDITNKNTIPQWENSNTSQHLLDGKVPYTVLPGNHDLGPNGGTANRDTYMNDYFNLSYYKTWPTLGGWFQDDKIENTYHLFSAGGLDWIVFSLEFAPRDAVVAWANEVCSNHSDRLAILITHNYMAGNWRNTGYGGNYAACSSPEGAATGEDLWQNFVKLHRNFVMVYSGHILTESGYLKSNGIHGNPVHQLMANFQMNARGGDGTLRLNTFNPDAGKIYVKTYSPYQESYRTESNHQFDLNWNRWNYINNYPVVQNPLAQVNLVEDRLQEFVDLNGDHRPGSGIFRDPDFYDGDGLTYGIWTGTGWGTSFDNGVFNASILGNGTLHVVPYPNMFGSQILTLNASDKIDGWVTHDITINIAPVNDRPVMNMTSQWSYITTPEKVISNKLTVLEDSWCNLTLTAYDPVEPGDESGFKFYGNSSATNAPFFEVDEDTGNVSFLPTNDNVGIYDLMVEVDDCGTVNNRNHFNFTLEVVNTNDAPDIITTDVITATQSQPYLVDYEATDIDPAGDSFAWSLDTLAGFLSMNKDTGELSGTPGNDDTGEHTVKVSVSDKNGGTDSTEFNITVENVNDPPVLLAPAQDIIMEEDTVDSTLNLTTWFSDPDGVWDSVEVNGHQEIWVDLSDQPAVHLVPKTNWSGTEEITFIFDDGEYTVSDTLNVTVENVNDPPVDAVIAEYDVEYTEEDTVMLHGGAVDGDLPYGDKLTFTWTSSISGDIGSGENLTVKLPAGFHRITLMVEDRKSESITAQTDITILEGSSGEEEEEEQEEEEEEEEEEEPTGLSSGAMVMIAVIIGLLLIGVVVIVLVLVIKRDKSSDESPPPPVKPEPAALPGTEPAIEETLSQMPAENRVMEEGTGNDSKEQIPGEEDWEGPNGDPSGEEKSSTPQDQVDPMSEDPTARDPALDADPEDLGAEPEEDPMFELD